MGRRAGYDRRVRAAAALVVGLAALALTEGARAAQVSVVVVPSLDVATAQTHAAVGLLVPGAGSTVTRAGAESSLVRGKVVSSLLGGKASGRPLITLARRPSPVTIYVVLPPPGRTHNTHRYP